MRTYHISESKEKQWKPPAITRTVNFTAAAIIATARRSSLAHKQTTGNTVQPDRMLIYSYIHILSPTMWSSHDSEVLGKTSGSTQISKCGFFLQVFLLLHPQDDLITDSAPVRFCRKRFISSRKLRTHVCGCVFMKISKDAKACSQVTPSVTMFPCCASTCYLSRRWHNTQSRWRSLRP